MYQDYQYLDPESDYEAALKLGPVSTFQEAQKVASMWNIRMKEDFKNGLCRSTAAICQPEKGCPQKIGEMTVGLKIILNYILFSFLVRSAFSVS